MVFSAVAFLFNGCSARNCTGPVTYFRYSRNGSWMDGYSITVKKGDDGAFKLIYAEDEHQDYGEMEVAVDEAFVQKLTDICNAHKISRWDGFHKSDKNVLDGSGFSLNVTYEGGGKISAGGYMRYPRGFSEFRDEINTLCAPYIKAAKAEALAQKIARGVSGECTFIMAQFRQRGAAGSDVYEILVCNSDIRTNNFDVKIKSASGEYFPAGEYKYYGKAEDASLNMARLKQIVDEYAVTEWMDWRASVEDYDNTEWFQLDLSFEEGDISATGSAKPAHYEQFRAAVLEWLKEIVEANQDKL